MRSSLRAALGMATLATLLVVPGLATAQDGGEPPSSAAEGVGAQEEQPAAAQGDGEVSVHGSGFGHGVGMSQYGARSLAEKGRDSDFIVEHYYEGVQTAARNVGAPGSRTLRVGLTANADSWRFDNDSGSQRNLHIWLEGDGDGDIAFVEPGQSARVQQGDGTDCEVRIGSDVEEADCADLAVRWPVDGDDPHTFVGMPRDEAHDLILSRGWIRFVPSSQDPETIHTVLRIHMEDYLYGLAEMPSSWPMEALKTQAVAGRTFALGRVANPRGASCSCDLLTTVSDQHYTGWRKEGERPWGERWQDAVDGTNNAARDRGRVIERGGALINAYYSSSSPGTTEDSRDIWGGTVPYLVPQDDAHAHDGDANNPYASWTRTFDYADFSQRLGFDAVTDVELTGHLRSGNPGVYEVTGLVDGDETTRELHTYRRLGDQRPGLRSALSLPSHGIWEIELEVPDEFSDVSTDHPFFAEIIWMVEEGLTEGYDDGTFRPAAGVSRQAAAAFLYRLAGQPDGPHEADFDDVDGDHPFHDEIAWAYEQGITSGYDDGTFRPARVVSRQAMAAFLANHEFDGDVPDADGVDFDDVDGDHPFHDEIAWAHGQGITEGYGDGTFRPARDVARQAAAAFLHRYAADD